MLSRQQTTPGRAKLTSSLQKIGKQQVEIAVKALFKHTEIHKNRVNESKLKKDLFAEVDEQYFIVLIALNKLVTKGRLNPYCIPLPHALHTEETDTCLFVKDPQREYKELFEKEAIKVSKVIGLSKLKKNYKTFEDKRSLLGSHDLFLTDKRVMNSLPGLLGKKFFEKKKFPIPVDLTKKKAANSIKRARSSAQLFIIDNAPCVAVKIARTSFSQEQVVENVLQGLDGIVKVLPGHWKNIQSINLKTNKSIALPIYNRLPDTTLRIKKDSTTTTTNKTNTNKTNKRKRIEENEENEEEENTTLLLENGQDHDEDDEDDGEEDDDELYLGEEDSEEEFEQVKVQSSKQQNKNQVTETKTKTTTTTTTQSPKKKGQQTKQPQQPKQQKQQPQQPNNNNKNKNNKKDETKTKPSKKETNGTTTTTTTPTKKNNQPKQQQQPKQPKQSSKKQPQQKKQKI